MATTEKPTRSTVYLEPDLHRALKVQAAETATSMSQLVNAALRAALREDRDDLEAFDARANEPTVTFEQMLRSLDLDAD